VKAHNWLVAGIVVAAAMSGTPALANGAGDSVGVVDPRTGIWYLRDASSSDTTSFYYGNPGDFPIVGDWDCDGVDTPGLYRRSDGYVYLRNSNTQGIADLRFFFGDPGDMPIAGDFDADGCDTVSLYRPSEQRFYIINELGAADQGLGAADYSFIFGNPGDKPFVGDFDNDGLDTIGLHRESTGLIYFRNTNTQGIADGQFVYGNPGDQIIAGRWVPGPETVGIYRPSNGYAYLRFSNTQGVADVAFPYGNGAMTAVAGDFGALPGGDLPPPRDGDLDPSFGTNGIVFTDFPGQPEGASDVAIQRDGKIVAVGTAEDGFALARYNHDGTLDPTFGTAGLVVTDFGTSNDQATSVAIQSDGRIVVAGRDEGKAVLARYRADGTPDPTFATGAVTAGLPGSYSAEDVAVQPDGKIVVSGSFAPEGSGSFNQILVMRFRANGTFDPTFGTGGIVTTPGAAGRKSVLQADGKIVVAGFDQTSFSCSPDDPCDGVAVLVRYNRNGTLDSSFGVGGKATTGRPEDTEFPYGIAVQQNGKILVAGIRDTGPGADALLIRFNANGSLDASFGTNGKVLSDFGSRDTAHAIAVRADGKIVVAVPGSAFAIARYRPDGTPDTSFGVGGKVLVDVGEPGAAEGMIEQPDGDIVAVGGGQVGNGVQTFVVVRLTGTPANG
jgi:uncharacterized delta-60 repeat protein